MPEYDKRKVIKVGEKSYAVTLPKKWCSEMGIKPGDILDLAYYGSSIVLKPARTGASDSQTTSIVLDVRKSRDYLMRELIACYIEGITRVKIKGDSLALAKLVNYLQEKLVGLVAISEVDSDYVELVFTDAPIDVDKILRRMMSLVKIIMSGLNRLAEEDSQDVYQLIVNILKTK